MQAIAKTVGAILLVLTGVSAFATVPIRYVCLDPKTMARMLVLESPCPSKYIENRESPDPIAGSGWSYNAYYNAHYNPYEVTAPAAANIRTEQESQRNVGTPSALSKSEWAIVDAGAKGAIQWLFFAILIGIVWGAAKVLMVVLRGIRSASGAAISGAKKVAEQSPILVAASFQSDKDDELFARALDELDSNKPDRACWAKALAISDGDETKARGAYIKFRVGALRR